MSDLKNYKFPTQGIELNNAFLENVKSEYSLNGGKELTVNGVINSEGQLHEGIYLGTMDDTMVWSDETIVRFAETELSKYEVEK
jgi:hypothetical protein